MMSLFAVLALPSVANGLDSTARNFPSVDTNIVELERSRITVLTGALLRIELRGASGYDDRPTLSFPYRSSAPLVSLHVSRLGPHEAVLRTANLTVHLDESKLNSSGMLTRAALSVDYTLADGEPQQTWYYGMESGNLGGTRHSLDCYTATDAEAASTCLRPGLLERGLLARNGPVLWDDTHRGRYDSEDIESAWISNISAVQAAGDGYKDWYLFAHGRRYTEALADYIRVGGAPLLPPTSALGVWWSRYNNYTQQQFVDQVLTGYANHALPLSHVVMDVDWHQFPGKASPAIPGCDGYGGFVWNSNLFPKPIEWVNFLHSASNPLGHPLKLLLNLHMDRGVDHCQPSYKAIARAAGLDASNNSVLQCDILNRNWTEALFKYALGMPGKPTATHAGADAWWTDYSGCPAVRNVCDSLDQSNCSQSMIWSNLIFARHQQMANLRPLVLSRFGGLGNHRAPLGFSGDSHACWQTLKYQIGFTSTAANILQMWSHDLGGFYAFDDGDPTNATGSELLLRWLQFGAVSPVFRTHCSGVHDGPHCLRRIWLFPHYESLKSAMVLRDALLPYLMTAYRHFHDTGVGVVHPCYYEYSQEPQAYATAESQYMFGTMMLAAPITDAAPDPLHGSVNKTVWLPPGVWVEWGGERVHLGPANYTRSYGHSELPLFVKDGSAIPVRTESSRQATDLCWVIFARGGRSGFGVVYDDEGDGLAYQRDEYSITHLHYETTNWTHNAVLELSLRPLHRCVGKGCSAWAVQRSYLIETRGLVSLGLSIQSIEVKSTTKRWTESRTAHVPASGLNRELVALPGRWSLEDEIVAKLRLARLSTVPS